MPPLIVAPGPVRNLTCNESVLESELSFSWNTQLEEKVTRYRVAVKELQEDPDKNVILAVIADFNTTLKWALVDQGLCKRYVEVLSLDHLIYDHVVGEVPYEISVTAINLAGCGKQQSIHCFTMEGGNVVTLKLCKS